MALDVDLMFITSPPLFHTPSYDGSYYSSDLSFPGDDIQMDDVAYDDIQMQDVTGSLYDYEPSDYDAPNQPASLWMFDSMSPDLSLNNRPTPSPFDTSLSPWLSYNYDDFSAGFGAVHRASSGTRSDRGAEAWGTLGHYGMTPGASRRMSPYPDPKASPRFGNMDTEFDCVPTPSCVNNVGSSGDGNTNLPMAWRATGSEIDVMNADARSIQKTEVVSSKDGQPVVKNRRKVYAFPRRRTQSANFACTVPGCGSTFTRAFHLKGHLRSHVEENLATQEYDEMTPRGMNPDPSPNASPRICYTDLDLDPDLFLEGDDAIGFSGVAREWGDLGDVFFSHGFIQEVQEDALSNACLTIPNAELVVSGATTETDVLPLSSQIVKTTDNTTHRRRKQEAKFVCTVPGCGSTFVSGLNLKGHLRAHFNDKPYKCHWPGCDKGFARQDNCKRHEKLHNNFRPFECEGCRRQFGRMDALNKHLKSEIGVECARIVETGRGKGKGAGGSEIGTGNIEGDAGGMVEQGRGLGDERETGSVAL
jgi:hypothetical protein